MSFPLFNFELKPLEQVQAWGEPHDPNLHWFGLTDGMYWIQAGDVRLFEYTKAAQDQLGAPQFCDYQIARLYEDVIDLAPYALEHVPKELRKYIAITEATPWNHHWDKWHDAVRSCDDDQGETILFDNAGSWLGRRMLDTVYLAPSTNISVWSDEDLVHVEWDNRHKLIEGAPVWTATVGCWQMPRAKFVAEVLSFHYRLMEKMAERVSLVAAGMLPSRIRVDLTALLREHEIRSRQIDLNLHFRNSPTDWQAVSNAVHALDSRT